MSYKYNALVFIGRLQPPHAAHIKIIERALTLAETVIVLIGSANQPRTIKNPWTWQERALMVRECFPEDLHRLKFSGIADSYNDQEWVTSIQETVDEIVERRQGNPYVARIGLIGHEKDDSSYYLKMFPQWSFVEYEAVQTLHATDIRELMFEQRKVDRDNVPTAIVDFIEAFMNSEVFENLAGEYEFVKKYKQQFEMLPYPPVFVTADAVVIQSGHVLLVKRKARPGKNLWAIPGGFVNQNERIEDAVLRELREETKIKIPLPVLKGNIKQSKVFDDPNRSLRGRTITHAFLIELRPGPLPKVKGSDDAEKAKWIPLNVVERMQDQLFEDHFHIINDLVDKL